MTQQCSYKLPRFTSDELDAMTDEEIQGVIDNTDGFASRLADEFGLFVFHTAYKKLYALTASNDVRFVYALIHSSKKPRRPELIEAWKVKLARSILGRRMSKATAISEISEAVLSEKV